MGTLEDFVKSNKLDNNILERFWNNVDKKGDDECWLWTGKQWKGGYGVFRYKGWAILVHRLSYYLANNGIKEDSVIRHRCNNKLCVNPKHLEMHEKVKREKGSWWNKGRVPKEGEE